MSSPAQTLTHKQKAIIRLVTLGLKNREIAGVIGTTEHVVKNYLKDVYDKLGMFTRLEVALWQMEHQIGVGEDF